MDNPFERYDYAAQYNEVRLLPPQIMSLYMDAMARASTVPERALDVGAGVGQFSLALARNFPDTAIVSSEPSQTMRAVLTENVRDSGYANVTVRPEALAAILDSETFDLIVLSEVVHLFEPVELAEKLCSLSSERCCIAIRTSSQEQLKRREWYRFFPRARFLDMQRHPSLNLLEQIFRSQGFLVSHTVIDESRTIAAQSFRNLLKDRLFSTLNLITPAEFAAGCAQLEAEIGGTNEHFLDYEMTLFTARRI